ncbi:MAG: hypothetical protein ISP49_18935 [Reyranella sp.]|nr:hypothetical protein [Reyranella sp.]MBL6653677.1 hypothetical protein [Reyranella sp.]
MRTMAVLALGVVTLGMSSSVVCADDAACEAVLAAIVKQTTVPVHQKITIETAAVPGRAIQSEIIHLNGTFYTQSHGQWTASPYDAAKAAGNVRQAMLKAEHSCTRLGSEPVDGQPAELYGVKSKSASSASEAQIWISSATGLPLRHNVTMDQGANQVKSEVRYEYANVRAPAGVAR